MRENKKKEVILKLHKFKSNNNKQHKTQKKYLNIWKLAKNNEEIL